MTNDKQQLESIDPYVPQALLTGHKVYVVQETLLNLVKATSFGELVPLLPAKLTITMNPAHVLKSLRHRLKNFSDSDYLVPIGDPIAIGLAFMVAADVNEGRFRALKWDRDANDYYPVSVDTEDDLSF